MIVGKNRWRVQLQRATVTKDIYQQGRNGWSTVGTYWAEVTTLAGREAVNASQLKAESTHKLTFRWLGTAQTIGPKDRLSYKGRIFHIHWINNDGERNRQLDVYCQEVVSPP